MENLPTPCKWQLHRCAGISNLDQARYLRELGHRRDQVILLGFRFVWKAIDFALHDQRRYLILDPHYTGVDDEKSVVRLP